MAVGLGKNSKTLFDLVLLHPEPQEGGGHTFSCPGTVKHLSMTMGSGPVLGQIKRVPCIFE